MDGADNVDEARGGHLGVGSSPVCGDGHCGSTALPFRRNAGCRHGGLTSANVTTMPEMNIFRWVLGFGTVCAMVWPRLLVADAENGC
jgi:hypothetical protein